MKQLEKELLHLEHLSQNDVVGLLVTTNTIEVKVYKEMNIPINVFEGLINSYNIQPRC